MNTIDFLRANEYNSTGSFLKEAQFRKQNWEWLKYSTVIALKTRKRMSELGWTQKQLAEALGCTQQHVSVLQNGKVNMTLETLAKLENALQFDLIAGILSIPIPSPGHLNEPSSPEEMISSGTSSLVDGYTPRKKKGPRKK